ncbi:MAG: AzlC family ABC transporter permease [Clostridia bacterium]|nr:AzlC family ABC transporter permease [Clostridia bacterium]
MIVKSQKYSLKDPINRAVFLDGLKNGIPIALGYFAVSFSLGIAAKKAGLSAIQGFFTSILCNASAGEYVGFTLIAENALYIEMLIATFVANARYMLMSCATSQRVDPDLPLLHRMGVAFCLTDEIFGISVAKKGYINPNYSYGAMLIATTGWSLGTALGIIAGNIMPLRLVSAFSVALYGMFLAIIIPPARKNKIIAGIITVCFVLSYICSKAPFISNLTEGTRTIILTVIIATAASILFPKNDD